MQHNWTEDERALRIAYEKTAPHPVLFDVATQPGHPMAKCLRNVANAVKRNETTRGNDNETFNSAN